MEVGTLGSWEGRDIHKCPLFHSHGVARLTDQTDKRIGAGGSAQQCAGMHTTFFAEKPVAVSAIQFCPDPDIHNASIVRPMTHFT